MSFGAVRDVRRAGPSIAQKRAYGIAANRACDELGIFGTAERRDYRRKIVYDLTGRESFADVRSNQGVDAVMSKLWQDAGDWQQAANYCINYERQLAYLVKVLAVQLMQLKGSDETEARKYLGGVLDTARIANGRHLDDGSYWLDIRPDQIAALLKILDTERRRILKRFLSSPGAVSDRVSYVVDGPLLTRREVERGYYAAVPFRVNLRRE